VCDIVAKTLLNILSPYVSFWQQSDIANVRNRLPGPNKRMSPSLRKLDQLLRHRATTVAERRLKNQLIADSVFATSPYLTDPNFRRFHADDIQLLYELYDEHYFEEQLLRSLNPQQISFRLSPRMTRAGGKTTRWGDRLGRTPSRYEIAISSTLLFESFQDPERGITVTGLECDTRLEALMRIMEHELVHLTELLVWTDSNCSLGRFQDIASRTFGHMDHRHDLITPSEVAVRQYGIRPGVKVRFDRGGKWLEGVVNRITKRATVLVVDPDGKRYSDGRRYVKYYIPVKELEPLE
jgi:hypothetical protein